MGQLVYGTVPAVFDIDDRALAHLEVVTLAKLRRKEAFALTIDDESGGRSVIWLGTAGILEFRYSTPRPEINRAWLDALIETANSSGGMRVVPEP